MSPGTRCRGSTSKSTRRPLSMRTCDRLSQASAGHRARALKALRSAAHSWHLGSGLRATPGAAGFWGFWVLLGALTLAAARARACSFCMASIWDSACERQLCLAAQLRSRSTLLGRSRIWQIMRSSMVSVRSLELRVPLEESCHDDDRPGFRFARFAVQSLNKASSS